MRLSYSFVVALGVLCTVPLDVNTQFAQPGPSITVPRVIHITGVFQPADGPPPTAVEVVDCIDLRHAGGRVAGVAGAAELDVDKTTGRFMLLLGASYPDGIPAEVFGTGQAHWMSLLFERAGEVEQPRVRIASVPYALKASDAETLGGLPASAYLRAPSSARAPTASGGASSSASEPPRLGRRMWCCRGRRIFWRSM